MTAATPAPAQPVAQPEQDTCIACGALRDPGVSHECAQPVAQTFQQRDGWTLCNIHAWLSPHPCPSCAKLAAAAPTPQPVEPAQPVAQPLGHTPVPARSVGLNRDWTVCKDCGLIQPKAGFTKPCRGPTSVELRAAQPVDDLVAAMVNRFLAWKLPADFRPDCGISFKPEYNQHTPWPAKHEPFGTNLFTADQARAMFEHCLPEQLRAAPTPQPVAQPEQCDCLNHCGDDPRLNRGVKLSCADESGKPPEPYRFDRTAQPVDDLVEQIRAFLADAPKEKPHTGYRYGELLDAAAARIVADASEIRTLRNAAVTATERAERAQPVDDLVALPSFIRDPIERAIEAAIHPKGMSVHDGKMRIGSDKIAFLLHRYDAAAARIVELEADVARITDDRNAKSKRMWELGQEAERAESDLAAAQAVIVAADQWQRKAPANAKMQPEESNLVRAIGVYAEYQHAARSAKP